MSKKKYPKLSTEEKRQRQRENSLKANHDREQQHAMCEMELRVKSGNYGLYCQEHNKWITWIQPRDLVRLSAAGIDL